MIDFIALFEASQNGNSILYGRLIDHDRLESSFQCGVFLNILSVLLEGRSADAVQFASGQHGLKHIACVHSAFRFACSDDRMQLIDKEDDLAVTLADVLQNGLKSLLKLASVLGACDQRSHIQGEDLLVLEPLRHVACGYSLGKTFNDRRLADAGFTDQNGIVLGLSGEDADHIADLRVSSNDGIQFLVSRFSDEFLAVLGKRIVGCLRIIRSHSLIASDSRQGLQKTVSCNSIIRKDLLENAVRVADEGQEQMLHTHILVTELLGLTLCAEKRFVEITADIDAGFRALHLVDAGKCSLRSLFEFLRVNFHLLDQFQDQTVFNRQKTV